ncbi:hypothetical protein QE152_g26278 [Popillia japonica]|uniref:Uncharacterized protein n=1 Tax=Popillia japonica TaxID=7064 RepID=A0AAW1JXT3_POPJA
MNLITTTTNFCKATNIEAMLVSRGAAGFFFFLGVALLVPVVDGMTFPDLGVCVFFNWTCVAVQVEKLPLVRKICHVAPLKGQRVALVWASEPRERAQLWVLGSGRSPCN